MAPPGLRVLSPLGGAEFWRSPEAPVRVAATGPEAYATKLIHVVEDQATPGRQVLLDLTGGEPVAALLRSGSGTPCFSHDGRSALRVTETTGVGKWERGLP